MCFARIAPGTGLEPIAIASGWQLQDVAKVAGTGADLSQPAFEAKGWYAATVPGTVLTSLVNDGCYPEPLYGENDRPDIIPDSLCRSRYWYRTVFRVPASFSGQKVWLHFEGINYNAEVWANGKELGEIKGAFTRGIFDLSSVVTAGRQAALAVLVSPQPHPGDPHEHTIARGMGGNGGVTAIDGPTFLCTIGWDWMPAMRDRDTGIWQKVFLSATGPVVLKDPFVTTDLPLPSLDTADVSVAVTVQNVTAQPQKGFLMGNIDTIAFEQPVGLAPYESRVVSFNPETAAALRMEHPNLWWPNGYGPQNLYTLHLRFQTDGTTSDQQDVTFGVRKLTYTVPDSDNLTVSVNGVRVLCKGGDWGMDEAMKRIPRERLEAQIRMHQMAHYTMIRNWVGQSTSEDFYQLCDKYGIMLWDEFFQPNPGDGPNVTDIGCYLANVREKILRFRNHPSIAIWCARNEGYPPKEIDDSLRRLMADLDPSRLYQPSSTAGRGVNSGGPYCWRPPRDYYDFGEAFKTEIGSVSIPTLESIHGMMPKKDWETIDDDWAEHDLAAGASAGDSYPRTLAQRYGKIANLADFARKGQLANYEAYRAIYEGRNARLFHPCTGVLTWMSNPAQPSFVWQLYHHDLEPNASLFAVRKACEPIHIQLNERNGHIQVINNLPTALADARAQLEIYNLDGSTPFRNDWAVTATPSRATDLGPVDWPATLSPVYFVKLVLCDANGQILSDNFYWRAVPDREDDLQDLGALPVVTLHAGIRRHDAGSKCLVDVTLHNPTAQIALMAHLQLRRRQSGTRVLPVYYSDNYISLTPNESKTVTVEAAASDLHGENPLIVVDGWNVGVIADPSPDAAVALNSDAQVDHWPVTGLPIYAGPPVEHVRNKCGGAAMAGFEADSAYTGGQKHSVTNEIDTSPPMAAAEEVYQTERWGETFYNFAMRPLAPGRAYTIRLHFAETTFNGVGRRKFNVDINGRRMLSDFDVFKEAGGRNKALVKEFRNILPNHDSNIQIKFLAGSADQPEINAVEITD
jgi:beta-mannosidase